MTVGVVGAGNMGRGIAASLARSGFGVAQYDITADLLASSAAQHEAIQAADSLAVLCRLADAGVLPKSLFEDSHREQMHNRTATKIQRVARGVFGRDVVRDKFARVIRKRYDIQKGFFYTNIVTKKTFDARPLLIPRLFPNSNF